MLAGGFPPPFRFGVFEVDPEAGELRKNGVLVRLPPQPFRLLLLLATHSGRVVSRDEIRKQLWGEDTFVDFDQGVNFSIRQIREALGDSAEGSRFVQTVPRRGYRFLVGVEPIVSEGAPIAPSAAASAHGMAPRGVTDVNLHKALWENIAEMRVAEQRRHRLVIALSVVVVLLALVLGWKLLS